MLSKKILIITYYWPPSGGVGVQRWMNFALQLEKLGWEPHILTPENPQFEIKDEKLLTRVQHLKTYRLPIWEPFQLFHKITGNKERKNVQQGLVMEKSQKSLMDKISVWIRGNIFIPDPRIFWLRKAAKFGIDLISRENISVMVTTGPPHSIHLIGKRIKRKTEVKWLADFRDPWSKWDVLQKLNTSTLAMQIHKSLEASVLKQANKVTTVSNRLAKAFGGVEVINNGVSILSKVDHELNQEEFTIGYFGMLNELRNPKQFWMMLDQMCREDSSFASKLRIKIGGIVSESIKEELRKFHELEDKVQFMGYLSHERVQEEYKKCNMLLLLLNKSSNSQWILPVKFFEYLAAGRMILTLGPRESDLGDIINQKDVGEIFSYGDIPSMRAYMEDLFEHDRKPADKDVHGLMKQFSHKSLVRKLDNLLTQMIDE
tara:strand:- start:262 stop:1551 length:1290 start_codon:yes stop_codon:yes gene_type:complete